MTKNEILRQAGFSNTPEGIKAFHTKFPTEEDFQMYRNGGKVKMYKEGSTVKKYGGYGDYYKKGGSVMNQSLKRRIFAEGGMMDEQQMGQEQQSPYSEINVEHGELLLKQSETLNGLPELLTKYNSAGMERHPEDGSLSSTGNVMAPVGSFVIPKNKAKKTLDILANRDHLYINALINNITRNKEKKEMEKELKDIQKQNKYLSKLSPKERFVAQYGGLIKQMYADGGYTTPPSPLEHASPYFNFERGPTLDTTYGNSNTMQNPLLDINNYLGKFNSSTSAPAYNTPGGIYPNQSPYAIEPQDSWKTGPVNPVNPVTGMNNYLSNLNSQAENNLNKQRASNTDVTVPTIYRKGFDANGNAVSINPNMPSGYTPSGYEGKAGGGGGNNEELAGNIMQAVPAVWNIAQGLKKPSKIPGTLGNLDANLPNTKFNFNAGRRDLERLNAANLYAWRNRGASGGSASLGYLSNVHGQNLNKFNENAYNTQGESDYRTAVQNNAYKQFNAQQAMQRYLLQAKADSVPTQYMSKGMENIGQMGTEKMNRELIKSINK